MDCNPKILFTSNLTDLYEKFETHRTNDAIKWVFRCVVCGTHANSVEGKCPYADIWLPLSVSCPKCRNYWKYKKETMVYSLNEG